MDKTSLNKLIDDDQLKTKNTIPPYLEETYWWAYLHPRGIHIFERQWLVNFILWGNYRHLREEALSEINNHFQGNMLQLACVYGDLTEKLASRLSIKGRLDLVDISQAQLDNALAKLGQRQNINLILQDTSALNLPDNAYDVTLLFFLLHEQPESVRLSTLAEAVRLTRKGGKIIIVDYHRAAGWNPLRYIMKGVFRWLEPFAEGFVSSEVSDTLPTEKITGIKKQVYFGGLYQKVIVTC